MNTTTICNQILERKAKQFVEENNYDYQQISYDEWKNYNPTEEDIVSIVESISYWSNFTPPGKAENWTKLQVEMYLEAKKKEKMCVDLLGRIPNMIEFAESHIREQKRKVLRHKLKSKISRNNK